MKTRLEYLKALFIVTLAFVPIIGGCESDFFIFDAFDSGTPPDEPILRIEAGMHTARVERVCVDVAERYLVTASQDKTARLWKLDSGELIGVLRVPIGSGNDGKLYTVAISPDGETVATAGWTSAGKNYYNIFLFDRASGQMEKRIAGHPNVIDYLTYSPDGRFLVATLGSNGIRIYETRNYGEIYRDTDYADKSYWADFDWQGRLVTSCFDGYLRLYDPSFRLIAKEKTPGGEEPFGVSFSPEGTMVAVGFNDSTSVNVLSGEDLSFLYAPDTNKADNGNLSTVAWSQDGQILFAGGMHDDRTGINPILRWTEAGRGPYMALSASTNTIFDIRPLTDGRVVFGAGDPMIGVLNVSGHRVWTLQAPILDHRDNLEFRISQNGKIVEFILTSWSVEEGWSRRLARFNIMEGRLSFVPDDGGHDKGNPDVDELNPPRTEAPGIEITDWRSNYEPELNGKALELKKGEMSRSLAITPDGKHFLLGTEWYLRFFDADGKQCWHVNTPDVAWGVNIASNGKFAVAAFADGTIRWYRISDGQEQVAFFPAPDGERWVLWIPEGFFNAASGGETLVGYHLNQGSNEAGEFVVVDQLYDLFYRPDLVARKLEGLDEKEILAELNRIGDVRKVLASGLPPVVELLCPEVVRLDGYNFTLPLKLTDKGGGIGKVVYRINGVPFEPPDTRDSLPLIPGRRYGTIRKGYERIRKNHFTLLRGDNDIEVTAFNNKGTIASRSVKLKARVENTSKQQSSLYVLAVGITYYRDLNQVLLYAASDAKAMVEELGNRGQGLFDKVEVKLLLDFEATTENIERAFEDFARRVKPSDVFVFYLAGHGKVLDGRYYFIPQELLCENQEDLRKGGIDQDKLATLLRSIPALKSLILLDTCNSGALAESGSLAVKTAIDRLVRATGRNVLAATSKDGLALEHGGHGVFTYILLQGLRGQADQQGDNDGIVNIDELSEFVTKEVPKITMEKWHYRQNPVRRLEGISFHICRTR